MLMGVEWLLLSVDLYDIYKCTLSEEAQGAEGASERLLRNIALFRKVLYS